MPRDIEQLSVNIRLENVAGDDETRIEIKTKNLLIDPKLRAAIANIPTAKRVFDAFDFEPVPQPSTILMLAVGLIGLGLSRKHSASPSRS